MHVRNRQLTLPFEPGGRPGDFVAAESNEAARLWLDNTLDWPNRRLALWGQRGSGKSSLAMLWSGSRGIFLAGPNLHELPLLNADRIVVDDADRCAAEPVLLHLLNSALETGCDVLLTARSAPAFWGVRLPDLASRLRATQAVEIEPADDALLTWLLASALAERQLQVPAPVQQWLLLRLPRTIAAVRQAAARLDSFSLTRQQPITRPLAAACLHDILAAADEKSVNDEAN